MGSNRSGDGKLSRHQIIDGLCAMLSGLAGESKPLENFKRQSDMLRFAFWKDHSSVSAAMIVRGVRNNGVLS